MGSRKQRQKRAEKRKKQQMKQMIIGVSAVAVVVVVALFVYYILLDRTAPLPDGVDTAYAGLPQTTGNSENGEPEYVGILGDPTAPIEVREYSSFACPHCKDLQSTIKQLEPYIEDGTVKLVFVPIYNIAGLGANEGAKAAICAGEQGKFFEMHDVMFYWQGRENYGTRLIRSAADQLGLDVDTFSDCFNSSRIDRLVREASSEFRGRDLTGTPSVFVNGNLSSNLIGDVEALLN
ncbi:MAG: thioredoxin domain-containing protein [Anaerolineales bacterium]|nr:thioredoxin domain-containing protein [Anaerolineales bacterium]